MKYKDIRLNQLFRIFIDGIPLDLTSTLLPLRSYLKPFLFFHVHLHSKSQKYFSSKTLNVMNHKMSSLSFKGLIDSLESAIKNMKWKLGTSEWSGYYIDTNYSHSALEHKKSLVSEFLDKINAKNVWDLGANVGIFSRIASNKKIPTISFDSDAIAIEKSYVDCINNGEKYLLPLVLDLTNPSPSIGWENKERISLQERGPANTVFALALIHHLVVTNNLPLNFVAHFLSKLGTFLIIEFVPKHDSYFQRLLLNRVDIFADYTQENFEHEFKKYFIIENSTRIRESQRTLYLMKKRI